MTKILAIYPSESLQLLNRFSVSSILIPTNIVSGHIFREKKYQVTFLLLCLSVGAGERRRRRRGRGRRRVGGRIELGGEGEKGRGEGEWEKAEN